jgi:hypothetical protein
MPPLVSWASSCVPVHARTHPDLPKGVALTSFKLIVCKFLPTGAPSSNAHHIGLCSARSVVVVTRCSHRFYFWPGSYATFGAHSSCCFERRDLFPTPPVTASVSVSVPGGMRLYVLIFSNEPHAAPTQLESSPTSYSSRSAVADATTLLYNFTLFKPLRRYFDHPRRWPPRLACSKLRPTPCSYGAPTPLPCLRPRYF